MLVGPIFTRELVTIPRRARLYVGRAAYVTTLLVLVSTAWQVLTGAEAVDSISGLARFAGLVFQILAPWQLVVTVFFAALSAALAVAHEKDRQTFDLLLLTRLANSELVLGKLWASLLGVLSLVIAAVPLFIFLILLGGVSPTQVGRTLLVTLASIVVGGSWGATVALWREKTFQTVALTVLGIVLWSAAWELASRGGLGQELAGVSAERWAATASPWHAVLAAARPDVVDASDTGWPGDVSFRFLVTSIGLLLVLNGVAIWRVRAWNLTREVRQRSNPEPDGEVEAGRAGSPSYARARTRRVWDNPVLWREVRTWAYGRRVLILKIVYLLLVVLAAAVLHRLMNESGGLTRTTAALPLAPLLLLSLVLVNAQAATSVTSERDSRALDLLLVTDLTPRELVAGKLGGVFYNAKDVVLLPLVLLGDLAYRGAIGGENLAYVGGGWLVLCVFAAVLGLHAGMTYANSRTAIGVSLGTLFFLFVGVATCMRIMVAFSGSFEFQLQPFLAAMVGGGLCMYVALGARNPSPAILAAAMFCPIATFYALASFFVLDHTLAVFLVTTATYGFTAAAMLVPALDEFDVATSRTLGPDESTT